MERSWAGVDVVARLAPGATAEQARDALTRYYRVLAAERGVAQVQDASTDTTNAFLAGSIADMQARLNLRNLVDTGAAGGGQVKRGRHGRQRAHHAAGIGPGLLSPAQQGIATQRHAHHQHGAGMPGGQAAQHPVDLGVVA